MRHLVFHGDGSVEKVTLQRSAATREETTFRRWYPATEPTPSWRLPPWDGEATTQAEEDEQALERTLATLVIMHDSFQRTQGIPASYLSTGGSTEAQSAQRVTVTEDEETEEEEESGSSDGMSITDEVFQKTGASSKGKKRKE